LRKVSLIKKGILGSTFALGVAIAGSGAQSTVQAEEAVITDESAVVVEEEAEIEILNAVSGDWTYNVSGGTATITEYAGTEKSVVIPDTLNGYNVYAIGEYVFEDSEIEEVVLPNTVGRIEAYAFKDCKYLYSVSWSSELTYIGQEAFYGCEALGKVDLPTKLKTIGASAFGFTNITEVTIPASVTKIEGYAFQACKRLSKIQYNAKKCTMEESVGPFEEAGKEADSLTVVFGDEVTSVPARLFYHNWEEYETYVTDVVLSDSIETIGEYAFGNCKALENITWGASITAIEKGAFYNCNSLTTLALPDTLKTIGEDTFANCTALKEITFGTGLKTIGVTAFEKCTSLEKLVLPEGLTTIEYEAFANCGITELTIPTTVTKIGQYAFKQCEDLSKIQFNAKKCTLDGGVGPFEKAGLNADSLTVTFGAEVTAIPASLFYHYSDEYYAHITTVEMSDSITTIGEAAFQNCVDLEKVTFGAKVSTIGKSAFNNCGKLQELVFSTGLKEIGNHAFEKCTSLNKLVLPEGLTTIGYEAFSNAGLTELTVPTTVTEIGQYAFKQCLDLNKIQFNAKNCTMDGSITPFEKAGLNANSLSVVFGAEVTKVPAYLFYHDNEEYMVHVTSVEMSDAIKTVGEYAFSKCNDLKSVTIGAGVVTIEKAAFENCKNLATVAMSDAVKTIDEYVFKNCTALKDVTFGSGLTSIDSYAFQYCTALDKVVLKDGLATIGYKAFGESGITELTIPKTVTEIGEYAFMQCPNLTKIQFNAKNCNLKGSVGPFEKAGLSAESLTVTFGEEVSKVPSRIFYHSDEEYITHVTAVELPDSVETVGEYAFANCGDLSKVSFGEKITTVEKYAFQNCSKLSDVTWNQAMEKIGESAFSGCSALTVLELPEYMEEIGNYAFQGCGLTRLVIPENLTKLGASAFGECRALNEIIFKAKNCTVLNRYGSAGAGEPFNKAGSQAKGLEVTFGYKVEQIPANLFAVGDVANYAYVSAVTISDTIKTIGDAAFKYCDDLKEITIPKTVTTIGKDSFTGTGLDEGKVLCYRNSTADNKTLYPEGTTIEYLKEDVKFHDVNETMWQYPFVKYAYDKGYVSGKGSTADGSVIFDPFGKLTREQFVTILHNIEGMPEMDYSRKFTDVPEAQWYTSPVLWAEKEGIVSGVGDGKFGTGVNISREQLATMLMNYAQYKGYDTNARADISGYADAGNVSGWATDAVKWAVANEIISGTGAGLEPGGEADRGQAATMIYNFMMKFNPGSATE